MEEIGEVVEVKDGVARVSGLDRVENFELVEIEISSGAIVSGLALNLEEYETGVVILGDYSFVKEGDTVKRTKKILSVPIGEGLLGRVVNPLGQPLDGKGEIKSNQFSPIERIAPSVIDRSPVDEPLHTGILAIDSLIPVGRGQRELILGDRGILRQQSL
jgi:F-type H+-transporting ATPase subunit alpha